MIVLSAAALSIEPWERDALIAVASILREGRARLDMRHTSTDIGALMLAWGQAHAGVSRLWSPASYCSPVPLGKGSASPALMSLFGPGWGTPRLVVHRGWGASAADGARACAAFLAGARGSCWEFSMESADA